VVPAHSGLHTPPMGSGEAHASWGCIKPDDVQAQSRRHVSGSTSPAEAVVAPHRMDAGVRIAPPEHASAGPGDLVGLFQFGPLPRGRRGQPDSDMEAADHLRVLAYRSGHAPIANHPYTLAHQHYSTLDRNGEGLAQDTTRRRAPSAPIRPNLTGSIELLCIHVCL